MAHASNSTSLTAELYALDESAVKSATEHPFLDKAGNGTLPASTLCTWLVQDKYYQLAYVNFIGGLLAKIPTSSCAFTSPQPGDLTDEKNLSWTTLDILIGALTNIRQEIDFYTQTVEGYSLPLEEAQPNGTTREYVELFEAASAKGAPVVVGLVVLWATERVCDILLLFYGHHLSYSTEGI
jgi:hypothetical protein